MLCSVLLYPQVSVRFYDMKVPLPGGRANLFQGAELSITGFYLDFSIRVIPLSESAGGGGAGVNNCSVMSSTPEYNLPT